MVPTIRPALTLLYAIAGRALCIEAADEWAATVASRFFRDFYLDPISGNGAHGSPFTIRIFSQIPPPSIPEGLNTFEVAFGQCLTDGGRYYLTVEDSVIATGIGEGDSLSVWIGKTVHARQSLSLVNLMAYALELSLRRCGLYQLHGAGLVTPDRKAGALILGASGSGKSTLTALLASRGWLYLTDDALLLEQNDDHLIHARGIRRFFAASQTTLASCSLQDLSHALGAPMLSDPHKRRLEPLIAFPDQFISSCVPKALFFASITDRDCSEVQRMTRTDTMARLIRSNPWATFDSSTARGHLDVLNRLTNQSRAFYLRAGRDVLNDPFCAEALLRPLMES